MSDLQRALLAASQSAMRVPKLVVLAAPHAERWGEAMLDDADKSEVQKRQW